METYWYIVHKLNDMIWICLGNDHCLKLSASFVCFLVYHLSSSIHEILSTMRQNKDFVQLSILSPAWRALSGSRNACCLIKCSPSHFEIPPITWLTNFFHCTHPYQDAGCPVVLSVLWYCKQSPLCVQWQLEKGRSISWSGYFTFVKIEFLGECGTFR